MKFDELLELNGNKLTKHYIQSLSKQERLDLIDPIFNLLRSSEFIYPDDINKVDKEWQRLLDYEPDLSTNDLFNNSSLATNICKYFCPSFYSVSELGKPTLIENFYNDDILKKIIKNRLGLDWLDSDEKGEGVNEAFNLSFKMIAFQGGRSMRLINQVSLFKPNIAKYMAMKYSNEGDLVFDYSAGFGGRLLGTIAAKRKYKAVDPLTANELINMKNHLKLEDAELIHSGSENYCGEENSVDLCWSSPPYVNDDKKFHIQEYFSKDKSQAYNNGEDYFYNIYWKQTLENAKFMLKPNCWFGLNIKDSPKMLTMAKQYFGEIMEEVQLRTIRSHLNKKLIDATKYESIYMFKNEKN